MRRGTPAAQQTKTLTIKRIGGPSDDKSNFWGIFTSHSVAKLLSLLLGVLLVFLIDREIEVKIYDSSVTITESAGESAEDHLEVTLPKGFILMDPKDQTKVQITIKGNKRDVEELEHPFSASIPFERIEAIFKDKFGQTSVPLEAADLRIAGVDNEKITLGVDAAVLVSRREIWACQLKYEDKRADQSKRLVVTFSQPTILISGPEELKKVYASLKVPVTSLGKDLSLEEILNETLPTLHRAMRLEPDQAPTMTATAPKSKTGTIKIPVVPILFVVAPNSDFEFQYVLPSPVVRDLELTGPVGKIALLKESKAEYDRLTKGLHYTADVESAARNMRSSITADKWLTLSDVEVAIPPKALEPWGLTPASEGLGSSFQARLRKATKKE